MSDTKAWPDLLAELDPEVKAQLPDGGEEGPQFPCPKCEKVFWRRQQLTGHLASHVARAKAKVPCPECGEMFLPGVGVASHRARRHGVPGSSKSTRAANAAKEAKAVKAPKPKPVKVEAEPQPHEWDVDDIFETVIGTMWPEGTVPLAAVIPLIIWREATQQLISSLNSTDMKENG